MFQQGLPSASRTKTDDERHEILNKRTKADAGRAWTNLVLRCLFSTPLFPDLPGSKTNRSKLTI